MTYWFKAAPKAAVQQGGRTQPASWLLEGGRSPEGLLTGRTEPAGWLLTGGRTLKGPWKVDGATSCSLKEDGRAKALP